MGDNSDFSLDKCPSDTGTSSKAILTINDLKDIASPPNEYIVTNENVQKMIHSKFHGLSTQEAFTQTY